MKDIRNKFDDWMVRVSFAEAGQPEMGMTLTDEKADWKARLAFDKIMVVRSEKMGTKHEMEEHGMKDEVMCATVHEPGSKLRVMVLDDEPIVGKRLKPALSKYGFDVEVYEDPTLALARLKEQGFDIVVTDLRMEELDGIQVLEYIMSQCKHTRVILITGYATVEVAREALVKGAFDFIAKPFKPNDLRAVINKAALSLGHVAA